MKDINRPLELTKYTRDGMSKVRGDSRDYILEGIVGQDIYLSEMGGCRKVLLGENGSPRIKSKIQPMLVILGWRRVGLEDTL